MDDNKRRPPYRRALLQDTKSRAAAKNHCGLHPGSLCICSRKCPSHSRLRYPHRHQLHRFSKYQLCNGSRRRRSQPSGSKMGRLLAGHHPGRSAPNGSPGRSLFQICSLQDVRIKFFTAYGLLRAMRSHNPTIHSHITGFHPAFMLMSGRVPRSFALS